MAQAGYTPISLYYSTTAAAAPTAGNLANGELAININDGKLYYKDSGGSVQLIASKAGAYGSVTSVDVSGGTTGLTTSGGPVTTSGTITLAGTLAVANGGTGQTTYTDGQLMIGNSTGNTLTKSTLTAGSGVTITNGSGSITISATGSGGTVTSVTASSPLASSGGNTPNISLTGTVGVANGGTGVASLTANNVIIGNGTSAVNFVAPGANGNILTSNGTTWVSSTPSGGSVSSAKVYFMGQF